MNAHVQIPTNIDGIEDEMKERRRGQGDITGPEDDRAMSAVERISDRAQIARPGSEK